MVAEQPAEISLENVSKGDRIGGDAQNTIQLGKPETVVDSAAVRVDEETTGKFGPLKRVLSSVSADYQVRF